MVEQTGGRTPTSREVVFLLVISNIIRAQVSFSFHSGDWRCEANHSNLLGWRQMRVIESV
jgi:hypothetical protein